MISLLESSQINSFFNYIRTVRRDPQCWNIVEIGILQEKIKDYPVHDVGKKLTDIFSDREGVVLICNNHEILTLVNWDKSRSIKDICHRVENNMPQHACYVNAEPMTVEGIERIQIKLMEDPDREQAKSIARKRHARTQGAILMVTADKELKGQWSALTAEYGKPYFAHNIDKLLVMNVETAPNMILWDIDTVRSGNSVPFNLVFSQDPDACIFALSNAMDVNAVMESKKAGVQELLKKPLNEKTLRRLVGECRHFGW